jgi:hypothetical protein
LLPLGWTLIHPPAQLNVGYGVAGGARPKSRNASVSHRSTHREIFPSG